MTHSPPVPPGNQSPYPIVEQPHETDDAADRASEPRSASAVDAVHSNGEWLSPAVGPKGIAALLGIGAVAALVAGLAVASTWQDETPKRRRKPRSKA